MKAAKAELICEECGELFTMNRVDQQFCSGRCRSRNFRKTQNEKLNTAERLLDKLLSHVNNVKSKVDLFA